ncbi:ice-binding family protein [Auraticoccus monumenti]|uniref:LPXTG-motif cell wall anchor domain-containing protein n=1 Tax=Auraticoccus monumenti TaxID=675864 RepID=A0A1G7BUV8_9ACTN|nr:ice-binding family protein [Auraticoccus monumenti]SDE30878.1 LPXTG-motif cell wall anchor domain-containing protein [Auraticoccus monumenti]
MLGAVVPDAQAAEARVLLGTAEDFSVLGAETVTNTGPSILSDNLGVSPGAAITGFPPGQVRGTIHAADEVAAAAQADLRIAYNDAAGRASTAAVGPDLTGETLVGGVYTASTTLALNGALTLDGENDPDAVFIFQVPSALLIGTGSSVELIRGAQACNVFWQVGSSATIDAGTTFVGSVMALASVSVLTGSTVDGRVLARTGQVSLQTNVFTSSACVAASPSPDPEPSGSPSPSDSATPSDSPSPSDSATPSPSDSATPSDSPSPSTTPTASVSPTATESPTESDSPTASTPPTSSVDAESDADSDAGPDTASDADSDAGTDRSSTSDSDADSGSDSDSNAEADSDADGTPTTPAAPYGPGGPESRLPDTGSGSAALVAVAAGVLLTAGAGAVWYGRRRRHTPQH